MIKAKITGTELKISEREPLLAGTVGLNKISLSFSDEWSGLTKQIDFTNEHSGQSRRISAEVDVCTVPWELLRDEGDISCYVRGISAEGKLTLRTNEENLGTVLSSQEDSVPDTGTPTPDVCLDTAAKLGDLTQLKTSEKTRLVGAINEVKAAADSKQDKLIAGENITIAADGRTVSAAGASGGVGVFEVTLDTQNGALTADKTFTQVKAAVEGGKPVLKVHSDGALLWFFLLDTGTTEIDFVGFADEQTLAYLTVKQDDSWESAVAARVTAELHGALSDKLGSLSSLTTGAKTSLVAAINELKADVDGISIPDPLPVASGGTGATRIRQAFTLTGNGITGLSYTAYHYPFLNLCFVRAYFKLSSELAAATPMQVLTIPEDYRPGYAHAMSGYCAAGALSARVSSGNGVQIRCPASKVATTQDVYVTGFWFV